MSNIPFAESIQAGNQIIQNQTQQNQIHSPAISSEKNDFLQEQQNETKLNTTDANILTSNNRVNKKYNIIDLYWVLNRKIKSNSLQPNEIHLSVLSYNINFGNLRISFYNLTNNSFRNNVLFLNNCEKIIDGTIYPTSAFIIVNVPNFKNLLCVEQIIIETGEDWQRHRPQIYVSKNSDSKEILLKINNYFYTFCDYQFDLFLDACRFCLKQGKLLYGINNLLKNS